MTAFILTVTFTPRPPLRFAAVQLRAADCPLGGNSWGLRPGDAESRGEVPNSTGSILRDTVMTMTKSLVPAM